VAGLIVHWFPTFYPLFDGSSTARPRPLRLLIDRTRAANTPARPTHKDKGYTYM